MKTRLWISFTLLAVVFAAMSCKESGKGKSMLPAVSGATNEILVITNPALWKGAVGDSVRRYFGQPQLGLPQEEPLFDLLSLPPASFDKNVKSHRNVLMISISNQVDSASVVFQESPWARSQKLFKISAPDQEEFFRIFDAYKEQIINVFLKAERDRLVNVYKKTPDAKIFNTFKNKYHLLLYSPGGYTINKDTNDFVWISAETRVDSKGVIFFQEAYESESQLNVQVILDRTNEELKKYIPGPLPATWMALDLEVPYSVANYNYQGKYYAIQIRGLWTVVNDFMAGPYVLNVVLDTDNNRIIYMMGYVYAPDGKKRNMLRQVESILYSMQLDINDQPSK